MYSSWKENCISCNKSCLAGQKHNVMLILKISIYLTYEMLPKQNIKLN